jgi:hypothetical protein
MWWPAQQTMESEQETATREIGGGLHNKGAEGKRKTSLHRTGRAFCTTAHCASSLQDIAGCRSHGEAQGRVLRSLPTSHTFGKNQPCEILEEDWASVAGAVDALPESLSRSDGTLRGAVLALYMCLTLLLASSACGASKRVVTGTTALGREAGMLSSFCE